MNTDLKKLTIAYSILFLLQVFFMAVITLNSVLMSNLFLFLIISITLIIYFRLKSNDLRLVLLVFISFASPMISYPVSLDNTVISYFFSDIFSREFHSVSG